MALQLNIKRAVKQAVKVRAGLIGPAGSGKTYTSLELATGLVTRDATEQPRILLIDSEAESALKYGGHFVFDHVVLPDHSPATYADALEEVGRLGVYDVVIIDSLSHAWIGQGGALEMVDQAAKRSRSGNSFTAWGDVTPKHRRMIDAILSAPFHVIATMRSKTEYVLEKNDKGREVPRKVGMAPVQRDGMEYEFDIVGDLTDTHEWMISKTRLVGLTFRDRPVDLGVIERPDRRLGEAIAAWCSDGETPEAAAERQRAAEAAAAERARHTEASEVLDGLELVRDRWLPACREASTHMSDLLEAIIAVVTETPTRDNARYLSAFKHLERGAPYSDGSRDVLEDDTMVKLRGTSAGAAHARYLLACYAHRYSADERARDAVVAAVAALPPYEAVNVAADIWTLQGETDRVAMWRDVSARLLGGGDDPDPGREEPPVPGFNADGEGPGDSHEEVNAFTSSEAPVSMDEGVRALASGAATSAEIIVPIPASDAVPEPTTAPSTEGGHVSDEDDPGAVEHRTAQVEPATSPATTAWCAERGRFVVLPFEYDGPGRTEATAGKPLLPKWDGIQGWLSDAQQAITDVDPVIGAAVEAVLADRSDDTLLERRAFGATLRETWDTDALDVDALRAMTRALTEARPWMWGDEPRPDGDGSTTIDRIWTVIDKAAPADEDAYEHARDLLGRWLSGLDEQSLRDVERILSLTRPTEHLERLLGLEEHDPELDAYRERRDRMSAMAGASA